MPILEVTGICELRFTAIIDTELDDDGIPMIDEWDIADLIMEGGIEQAHVNGLVIETVEDVTAEFGSELDDLLDPD